jgi:hypothetical protein
MGYQWILESCTLESALGLCDCCEKGRRPGARWFVGCGLRDAVLEKRWKLEKLEMWWQPRQAERRAIVERVTPTVEEMGPIWSDAILSWF